MKKLDDVREVFKSIKHRSPTQIYCPRCCSPKIKPINSLAIGGIAPKQYYCENCNYVGSVVMELEKDEKEREETDA